MRKSIPAAIAVPLCAILAIVLFPATGAFGQGRTLGYIFGEVDSNLGPVADATVTAYHPDSGRTYTAETDANGRYRISAIEAGRYAVFAALGGLQSSIVPTDVNVGEGTSIGLLLDNPRVVEEILVIAEPESPLDVTRAETARIVTSDDVRRLPIARDPNSVVLMAPGAVQGDQRFGATGNRTHYGTGTAYSSLGGASVAENVYYINGMNVTNFRTGLGGSSIPFEFYEQFQIKTGGYAADFGRATGGVVNAVTKQGTNEWRFSAGGYYAPDALRGDVPNVEHPSPNITYNTADGFDERSDFTSFVSAGGPLVENRLFVYGIYEYRDIAVDNYSSYGRLFRESDGDGFRGLKLDWLVTDNHSLEYTGFSDARTVRRDTYGWNPAANTTGRDYGATAIKRGGDNHIFTYRGHFGAGLAATVLFGVNEYDLSSRAPNDETCPVAVDGRFGGFVQLGCWTNVFRADSIDKRDVARIDIEWAANDFHLIRFGMDREQNTSEDSLRYSGDGYFQYYPAAPGMRLPNGEVVPRGVHALTRYRQFRTAGDYDVVSTALYIEDEWTIESIGATLRLGLRNERYDNRNAAGQSLFKLTDNLAPRIGFSWDIGGDRSSKIFANYGRYHLPVASVVNIVLGSPMYNSEGWYALDQPIAENGGTVLGAQLGQTTVFADGSAPDVRTVADRNLEAMAQDEIILGYERLFRESYIFGVTFTWRELKQGVEDISLDEIFGSPPGRTRALLANPGNGVSTFYDVDGDGELEAVDLSAEQLGFPRMKRRYNAVTLDLQRRWDGEFYARASYTVSRSYGNYEGTVRSDTGESFAGITSQFDYTGLVDGAYGLLPNDRRHQLKTWLGWEFAAGWQAGAAFHFSSGRPRNVFGYHPDNPYARLYGPLSFYRQGKLTPRGSQGTTSNVYRLDLGLKYTAEGFFGGALVARVDVFNVLNLDAALDVDEFLERWGPGTSSPTYGFPIRFQQPRTVRFGLRYEF